MASEVESLIADRKKTHGEFKDVAAISQATKRLWQSQARWAQLTDIQKEGLEYVAHKIARVLSGNSNFRDHWLDISGYVERVLEEIDKE
jgi:hypothetical protein